MEQKKYKLRYLPIFSADLTEAVTYISNVLHNPQAAERLVNDTEKAIMNVCTLRCHISRINRQRNENIPIIISISAIFPCFML